MFNIKKWIIVALFMFKLAKSYLLIIGYTCKYYIQKVGQQTFLKHKYVFTLLLIGMLVSIIGFSSAINGKESKIKTPHKIMGQNTPISMVGEEVYFNEKEINIDNAQFSDLSKTASSEPEELSMSTLPAAYFEKKVSLGKNDPFIPLVGPGTHRMQVEVKPQQISKAELERQRKMERLAQIDRVFNEQISLNGTITDNKDKLCIIQASGESLFLRPKEIFHVAGESVKVVDVYSDSIRLKIDNVERTVYIPGISEPDTFGANAATSTNEKLTLKPKNRSASMSLPSSGNFDNNFSKVKAIQEIDKLLNSF